MINQLRLRNFKSARNLDVCLNQLTVLSGLNGSGKSTILQAIGLVKQSMLLSNIEAQFDIPKIEKFFLLGPLVQIGTANDALSQHADTDEIQIGLGLRNQMGICNLVGSIEKDCLHESSLRVQISTVPCESKDSLNPNPKFSGDPLAYLGSCAFQYLQADRLTPKTHYERDSRSDYSTHYFLGTRGEYTPDFLAESGGSFEVSAKRRAPQVVIGVTPDTLKRVSPTPTLLDQISGWLQHLSPGVQLEAQRINSTDLITLAYKYLSTQIARDSDLRRPTNVGFGLTYSLPIITACLSAPKNSLLLIENPEAHLHPRGQVAMGALIAKCAGDGVQIIVETHSDHIVNGIRLAVKQKCIANTEVGLCHFKRDIAFGESSIESPTVLPNGSLSDWPEGFFDEWEKSLENLLS